MPYFHVVFTLPAPIGDIAYQNKGVIYDLLFKAAAETMLTIAADPKHLGASIGITSVLHTWGSAMTHHPHVHMIVPGGGLRLTASRWIACRADFFLPVRVLSRLFRRLFLEGSSPPTTPASCSSSVTSRARRHGSVQAASWRRCARPSGSSTARAVRRTRGRARYLSRYTHRVAISNSRLVARRRGVTFSGRTTGSRARPYKTMTLDAGEFIRRFLLHVLPGLPSHPPLRAVRQRYRAESSPRASCSPWRPAIEPEADEKDVVGRSPRSCLLSVPLLRRAHAHHRGLRARHRAEISASACSDAVIRIDTS